MKPSCSHMGAFTEEGMGPSNPSVWPTRAQCPPHLFLPTESLKVVADETTFAVTTGLIEKNCTCRPNVSKAITSICMANLCILSTLPHNLHNRLFQQAAERETPSSVWICMQCHPLTPPPPPSPPPFHSLSLLAPFMGPGAGASSEHGPPWLLRPHSRPAGCCISQLAGTADTM